MIKTHMTPSEMGLELIERHLGCDVLQEMRSGSHLLNPYHNLIHELQVVYWTHAMMVNDSTWSDQRTPVLVHALRAAAFHDHNHSGGLLPDRDNIDAATLFVSRSTLSHTQAAEVNKIIRVTEFSGLGFPNHPTSLDERAIRDADLCAIYSWEGRDLLLGLSVEMGHQVPDEKSTAADIDAYVEGHGAFLRNAVMHTKHGKRLKQLHLERSLAAFKRELRQRFYHEQ